MTNGVVRVPVLLSCTQGVASVEVRVSYNSYLLSLVGVTNGPLSGTEWGLEYVGGGGFCGYRDQRADTAGDGGREWWRTWTSR